MTTLNVVAGVFIKDNKVLIARRNNNKSLAGYWEFPGGKIEPEENERMALKRELLEELAINCQIKEFICVSNFDYPNFKIKLSAYYCETDSLIHQSTDHDKLIWINPIEYLNYKIAPADIPIFKKILRK